PPLLGECGLKESALVRLRRHQPHAQIVVREEPLPTLDDLNLAFDFLQNRAMHHEQFVRLRRSEGPLGPLAEGALDGLLDFRKNFHGCCPAPAGFAAPINPKLLAAVTISAAAGAASVPQYCPFSTSTAKAIRLPAVYGAKPMNQACEGLSASSA